MKKKNIKKKKVIISKFQRQEVWNHGVTRLVPSEASEGTSLSPWFAVVAGRPWTSLVWSLGDTSLKSLPLISHAHSLLPYRFVCLCPNFLFIVGIPIEFRVPLTLCVCVCVCAYRHVYMHALSRSVMSDSSTPWTVGSSVHGITQARILEWVAIPFSRGSSWPRDEPSLLHCVFFTIWATREVQLCMISS